jgi:regulatory protein YycI of two-component signal transduction system YycFG
MNWEMAKTWLIVSFFILDLILGVQVYQSHQELLGYVESYPDQLANTKTLLAEHGFSLNASVPAEHPDMPFVRANYTTPPLPLLGKTAFPTARSVNDDERVGAVQCTDGTLTVTNPGMWKVNYSACPKVPGDDLSTALHYVWHGDSYVRDTGFEGADTADSNPTVFIMQFNTFPVFDASIHLDVKDHQLLDYTQTYLENVAASGDKKPTISALDALNNLASTVDKSTQRQDNRILSVQLGYYHKIPGSSPDTDHVPTTSYWFPVWRVMTARETFYVNAFTGEVETPS